MPAIPTYSLISYAPATARTQLATTCRHARYAETRPVQPLKGLRETRAASVSYRASVPAGHDGCGLALSYRASSPDGETQPVPAQALSNRSSASTQFFSDWHSVSTTAPPFRHTPCRFWPQETPPVWRNLRQNPRLFLQETPPVWRNLRQNPRNCIKQATPVWRNLIQSTPNS